MAKSTRDAAQEQQATLLTSASPSVGFIQNHLDEKLDPAFAALGIEYDLKRRQFVREQPLPVAPDPAVTRRTNPISLATKNRIYKAAADAQQALLARLPEKLRPTPKVEIDTVVHSWTEVLGSIDKAVDKYAAAGKLRREIRKVGEHAPVLKSWMRLFPNTAYSATLLAGLTLVLDGAVAVSKIREQVLDMLSEIPYRITKTNLYAGLYDGEGSERLHAQSSKLYETILEAVGLMLDWIAHRRKFIEAILKGPDNYGKEIREKLEAVEKVAQLLKDEADILSKQTILKVYDGMENNRGKLDSLGNDMTGRFDSMGNHMSSHFDSMGNGITGHFGSMRNDMTDRFDSVNSRLDLLNHMLMFLNSSQLLPPKESRSDDTMHVHVPYPIKPVASRKTFRQEVYNVILQCEPEAATDQDELRICFANGQVATVAEKDRVNFVLKSPQLLGWLMEPTSSALLINGHSDTTAFISPMSHLCAFLAESLKTQRTPSGVFFCGLRCSTDSSSGARDLVKSLIAQLMSRFEFDFSFLQGKKPRKLRKPGKLCWLLRELLEMLPEGTLVFWIVDGVPWFENRDRISDTRCVFAELLRITRESKRVIVKLLVTSAYRSCEVANLWEHGTVLDVPTFVDGERQDTLVTCATLNDVGRTVLGVTQAHCN